MVSCAETKQAIICFYLYLSFRLKMRLWRQKMVKFGFGATTILASSVTGNYIKEGRLDNDRKQDCERLKWLNR